MQFAILVAPTVAQIEQKIADNQPIPLTIEASPGANTQPGTSQVELTNATITEKQHNREISLTGRIGEMGNAKVLIQHQFNPIGRITV